MNEAAGVIARIAARLRITEGQLYTFVLALLAVTLVLLTGLPGAGNRVVPKDTQPTISTEVHP